MKTPASLQTLEDYLTLNYPITYYPEKEGGYTVMIQDLPGCNSTGETLTEAIQYQDPIPLPEERT